MSEPSIEKPHATAALGIPTIEEQDWMSMRLLLLVHVRKDGVGITFTLLDRFSVHFVGMGIKGASCDLNGPCTWASQTIAQNSGMPGLLSC